jgi:hypothetical protein
MCGRQFEILKSVTGKSGRGVSTSRRLNKTLLFSMGMPGAM